MDDPQNILAGAQIRCVVESILNGLSDERIAELTVVEGDEPPPGSETLLGNLNDDEADLIAAGLHECLNWSDLLAVGLSEWFSAEDVEFSDDSSACIAGVGEIDAVKSHLVEIVRDFLVDPGTDPAGLEWVVDATFESCWAPLLKDTFAVQLVASEVVSEGSADCVVDRMDWSSLGGWEQIQRIQQGSDLPPGLMDELLIAMTACQAHKQSDTRAP